MTAAGEQPAVVDLLTVRLMARGVCPDCGGDGSIRNDDWTAFEEWRTRRPVMRPDDEDDLVEQYFLVVCDYAAVPPMARPCETCDESGTALVEVTVRQLLEFIYEHVDQPILPATMLDELVDHVKGAITRAAMSTQGLVADPVELGSWLRAVQEGAEALRAIGELRGRRRDG